ncbi:hypothetical protein BH23BAC3_BH23BAC3_31320 [soil metagenome]
MQFSCENVFLNVNQTMPGSLIVNEVITNIIKHGFKDRKQGNIALELQQKEKNGVSNSDYDGHGLPENYDSENTSTLGMQLIKTLTILPTYISL